MLSDAIDHLRCPNCAGPLTIDATRVRCPRGHSFDISRHGYLTLRAGAAGPGTGDTAEMVAARQRFLDAGHYSPISDAIRAAAPDGTDPVLDLGAGTGHYLARLLGAQPHRLGLAVDLSGYALRRAARAHPHIAAIGADVWQPLPIRSGRIGLVLNVFAPRNAAEIARVLTADGSLLVVTPAADHLGELVAALGLVGVDAAKPDRLAATLADFDPVGSDTVRFGLRLDHDQVAAVVGMGPSARHLPAGRLAERIADLPTATETTAAVTVASYRLRR
nr:23S rRNA methyltransferase [Actinocatenispora thailandica]